MSLSFRLSYFIFFILFLQVILWNGIKIEYGKGLVLWKGTREYKPDLGIVPDLPSEAMVKAFSFGDKQFFFRKAAYGIQNAGDTFGRVTALKDYDYSKLYKWWVLLDSLDSKSDYIASLVSYYFSATQDPEKHIPYVVKYLEQHADKNPSKKWWWYTQAVYHAKHKIGDIDSALRIATKLNELPIEIKIPIWARQMKVFILEDEGEYQQACEIILNILDTYKGLEEHEVAFMLYFIKERINAMEISGDNVDPRCKALYRENNKN